MEQVSGWSEQGGTSIVIPGTQGSGTQRFQQSFRGATVTVRDSSNNLATIYSDDLATPTAKANPFTASSTTGSWSFFTTTGTYSITFSGGSILAPFSITVNVGLGNAGGVPSYAYASLPTSKTQNAGDIARVTDVLGGLWMDSGSQWAQIYPVINAAEMTGANAGAKIIAALARLPAAGGVVDARGLSGAQAISSSISITVPTQLLLGDSTFTFSSTGAIVVSTCGVSIIGNGVAATVLKPAAAYTGTFITVQLGNCANVFGYNHNVTLRDFLIMDGNNAADGSGRVASCDGILLRDTDNVVMENVSVWKIKGTSFRLRNIRESKFYNCYSFMGGDTNKPSVWLGNTVSETLTDDCNNLSFYNLGVIYPFERGLLIATANASSLTSAQVCRGIYFHDSQFEGRAIDLSGVATTPAVFNIIELPAQGSATQAPSNNISFINPIIVNWNVNNAVAGLWVGYTSAGSTIQNVTLVNPTVGGFQFQTPAAATGVGVVADYVETLEIIGGIFASGSASIATLNVTANAVRVYSSPATRFIQLIADANGTGITGTMTNVTGWVTPVSSTETYRFASQNVQILNAVGNPASTTANLKVSSNSNISIITTDSASATTLKLRSGASGGLVSVDQDTFNVGRFAATNGTATVAGDYALSGWGASATLAVTAQSRNTRGTVTVTTNAADTPSANPTITLTFKDGAFTTAPFATASWSGGSGLTPNLVATTTSTTQLVLTYAGTPTATSALTYAFTYMVIQ